MLFDRFVEVTREWWTTRLGAITGATSDADGRPLKVLYPQFLLATQFPGFYVAEFVGATEQFSGFTVKRRKDDSLDRYFNQFDALEKRAGLSLVAKNIVVRGACIAANAQFEEVQRRFPQLELFGTKLLAVSETGGDEFKAVSFGPEVTCALSNTVLVNQHGSLARCKHILLCIIVNSSTGVPDLKALFDRVLDHGGVYVADGRREQALLLAGQFQNLYLSNLRETTIGEFLQRNPEIVKRAFKTEHFEYEPYLEWKERDGTCEDTAINPDLMVKREDGFFDIYDLKTARHASPSLTKGKRNRRRFIDYVNEGLAQLANYREYFQYQANADWARDRYGIEVHEPKLVLVVGSWENANQDEIRQALRAHSVDVSIIDYDTFCQFFIGGIE